MLSRFASTVETLDDYECASRTLRHIFLCSVSVDIQRTSLQVLWLVCVQLHRAGLGRYTVCRRFSKHATPIKAHPGQNGVARVPSGCPESYYMQLFGVVCVAGVPERNAGTIKGLWGLSILPVVPLNHVEIMEAIPIFDSCGAIAERPLALIWVFLLSIIY